MPVANSVTVVADDVNVYGNLTNFVAVNGDFLVVDGIVQEVQDRPTADHIILKKGWPGTSGTDLTNWTFIPGPYWNSIRMTNKKAQDLIDRITNGLPFKPDQTGNTAGRSAYDNQPKNFSYLDTSVVPNAISFKRSNTSGDWSAWAPLTGPQGDPGAAAEFRIESGTYNLQYRPIVTPAASWTTLVDLDTLIGTYRTDTMGYRDAALDAQTAAEDARDTAIGYATTAHGVHVPGSSTDYSSLHWSVESQTFASNSATSASAAATSAAAAASSATTSVTAFTNFRNAFYGPLSADPTLRPDGSAMVAGDFYYKTTAPTGLRVWTGTFWDPAVLGTSGFMSSSGGNFTGRVTFPAHANPGNANVRLIPGAAGVDPGTLVDGDMWFREASTSVLAMMSLRAGGVTQRIVTDAHLPAQSYPTKTGLSALFVADGVKRIEVQGYTTVNDGGRHQLVEVGSSSSKPGSVSTNGGTRFWEIDGQQIIRPQMFGATGVEADDARVPFSDFVTFLTQTPGVVSWLGDGSKYYRIDLRTTWPQQGAYWTPSTTYPTNSMIRDRGDSRTYKYIGAGNYVSGSASVAWAPSTSYVVGDRRTDSSGGHWECRVAHTSGTSFFADYTANSLRWKTLFRLDREASPANWVDQGGSQGLLYPAFTRSAIMLGRGAKIALQTVMTVGQNAQIFSFTGGQDYYFDGIECQQGYPTQDANAYSAFLPLLSASAQYKGVVWFHMSQGASDLVFRNIRIKGGNTAYYTIRNSYGGSRDSQSWICRRINVDRCVTEDCNYGLVTNCSGFDSKFKMTTLRAERSWFNQNSSDIEMDLISVSEINIQDIAIAAQAFQANGQESDIYTVDNLRIKARSLGPRTSPGSTPIYFNLVGRHDSIGTRNVGFSNIRVDQYVDAGVAPNRAGGAGNVVKIKFDTGGNTLFDTTSGRNYFIRDFDWRIEYNSMQPPSSAGLAFGQDTTTEAILTWMTDGANNFAGGENVENVRLSVQANGTAGGLYVDCGGSHPIIVHDTRVGTITYFNAAGKLIEINVLETSTGRFVAANLKGSERAYNQCQLQKSGANLVLVPLNGQMLTINGVPQKVTSPTLAPPSAGGLYYIYATMAGSTMTLEMSNTARATHTDGTQIKSGDPTRAFVGLGYVATTSVWTYWRSWHNRDKPIGITTLSADRALATTSFTEIHSEIRNSFLIFADENVMVMQVGDVFTTSATLPRQIDTTFGFDGTTGAVAELPWDTKTVTVTSVVFGSNLTLVKSGLSEGFHYCTVLGAGSDANNSTWRNTRLRVAIL